MTLGELLEALGATMNSKRTVSGISGIAQLFGVSISSAKRIKASGIIDKAISQSGRLIITDAEMALSLYNQAMHGHKTARF